MASITMQHYRAAVAKMNAGGLAGFISATREHIRTGIAGYPGISPTTRAAMLVHFSLMIAAARAECLRRAGRA